MDRLIILWCLAGLSCGPSFFPDDCPNYRYESNFRYENKVEETTPGGVRVDFTGQNLNPTLIDRAAQEVEECLIAQFGNPVVIPPELMSAASCETAQPSLPYRRECLAVKIPDDWTMNCSGTEQVLPYGAPDQLCRDKGLNPTPECPCRWRVGTQDDHWIVATPNLRLLKAEMVRHFTGCNNAWIGALATCSAPIKF